MICQGLVQKRKKSPLKVDVVHPELAFYGGKLKKLFCNVHCTSQDFFALQEELVYTQITNLFEAVFKREHHLTFSSYREAIKAKCQLIR